VEVWERKISAGKEGLGAEGKERESEEGGKIKQDFALHH